MTTSKPLVSLCFETTSSYLDNLSTLKNLVAQAPDGAIIVAPEVCLSGFDYDRFEEAAHFTNESLIELLPLTQNKTLIFTAITFYDEHYFNTAYVLHRNEIVHQQSKYALFELGKEHNYFSPGNPSDIAPFFIDGIKVGILICFELRFKDFWKCLEGCDIIAVSAQWGKLRAPHFRILTQALAVMNQCFVVASDAMNEDTSGLSGIITPNGDELRNNGKQILTGLFEEKTISHMRRYINTKIGKK